MNRFLTGTIAAVAAALSLSVAFPAQSATDAACKQMWSQADRDKNKSVSMSEARVVLGGKTTAAQAADTNKDGKLSAGEFLAACKKGAFDKKG